MQKREGNKILDSRWTNQKGREEKREPQMEKVISCQKKNGKGELGGCLLILEGTLVLKFNGGPS